MSQQDSSVRLESQCEAQTNADSDPTGGLSKRAPLEHLVTTPLGVVDKPFVHYIDNVGDEQYEVVLEDGTLRVYDELGVSKTIVNGTDAYLTSTGTSRDSFRAVTVEDTTFIVNKERTPTMGTATTTVSAPEFQKIIRLVGTGYNVDYSVTIDGFTVTHTSASTGDVLGFDTVLLALKTLIDAANTAGEYGTSNVVCKKGESTLLIYDTTPYDTVITVDSSTGFSLKLIDNEVDNFSDLPNESFQNHRVKIRGDVEISQDDYFVRFERDTGTSDTSAPTKGRWIESVGFGVNRNPVATTLPQKITRDATGTTFTVAAVAWDERVAGDDETNEVPSFFGKTIDNIFWHKDRLGFLTGNNITLTESGVPTNLFRTTVLTLVDSDRIDFSGNDVKSGDFLWAVPFNEELILFTGRGQHVLPNKDVLSPGTVELNTATHFSSEPDCEPILIGKSMVFAESNGDFAGIREYFLNSQTDAKDSALISGHIPEYIPGKVIELAGDSTMKAAFALTEDNTGELYVYRFFWVGNEKVQSSWSTWDFPNVDEIYSIGIVGKYLTMVCRRGTEVTIERLHLGFESGDVLYMDALKSHTGGDITDNGGGSYTVTFPLTVDESILKVAVDGVELTSYTVATNDITFSAATLPTTVTTGYEYQFQYQWTEPTIRTQGADGRIAADESVQALMVRDMILRYKDSRNFTIRTTMVNRDDQSKELDLSAEATGEIRLAVLGNSKDTQFFLESTSIYPLEIISTTWMFMPTRIAIPA